MSQQGYILSLASKSTFLTVFLAPTNNLLTFPQALSHLPIRLLTCALEFCYGVNLFLVIDFCFSYLILTNEQPQNVVVLNNATITYYFL